MPKALEQLIERHTEKKPSFLSMSAVSGYFLGAAVLVVAGTFALYNSFDEIRIQRQWIEHTREVQQELELIHASVVEGESASRGYLISGNPLLIEHFTAAEGSAQLHIDRVRRFLTDNPEQIENLAFVEKEVLNRFKLLQARIDYYNTTKQTNQKDSIEGLRAMQSVRIALNEMKEIESRLLEVRAVKAADSEKVFYVVLVLTTIFTLGGIAFTFRQYKKNQDKATEDTVNQAIEAFKKTKLAEVARLVSGDQNIQQAANSVLPYVAGTVNALVGKLFLQEDGVLKCYGTYASEQVGAGSAKTVSPAFETASLTQGLLGEAFRRDEVIVQKNLPKDFLFISSSLGKTNAQTVIFIPITYQNEPIGVIELGLLEPPAAYRVNVLDEYSEVIGVGLNASIVREHTHSLLEKTQQQAEELESQQEELRTTNEELEQQARAMELQQESLNLRNQELEETRAEVELKASDLERTSRYKSEFLAKMSHELRTPLNSLLILASLLIENKEKTLTDKQIGFSQSIRGAGQDLLNLINDILDLSKIEARKLTLRPESFGLESFFNNIKSTFAPQLQGRDLSFQLEVDSSLKNAELTTDRLRLEQILRNFISNAIKFTSKGQIVLGARPRSDNRISIYVRDTGVGIPKDKQKLIFEAFEQVDNSLSRSFSGTGLGLTISKELATLLGGEIHVESQEGVGSTFNLTIPMELNTPSEKQESSSEGERAALRLQNRISEAKASNDNTSSASSEVNAQARAALAGIAEGDKTILIVEDDEKFRGLVAEAAEGFGLKPVATGDGEVALAILEMHTPASVLLDIKLPGISGLGLLEIIKRSPRLRHIPTHMISALEYQQNALRSGAMGYLTKPVTIDKVKSALSRIEGLLSRQVRRLLIVEDDQRQQDAIRHLVEGKDIEIVTAAAGDEALKAIQSQGFDCIILDLSLPDMSGIELLESIENLNVSVPPVVVYTGRDLTRDEIKKLKSVSGSIIIKGAKSPERLLDEVNLFLHRVENHLPHDKRQMLEEMRGKNMTFEGRKALVVDDDLRNIFALTNALESKGFEVESAVDGLEAIEMLEKRNNVDVILMDIMMPKMDGFEAMKRIRQMKDHAKTPIIALTAKAMKGDHENCIAAGASDYLPKPVNLNNLFSVLKVWLQNKGPI